MAMTPWQDTKPGNERRRVLLHDVDKQALSLAFGGIESLLFLGSNFGASLERLSQLPKRESQPIEARFGNDGVTKLAYGVEREYMHVHPTHSVRISDEPWKLEAYACSSNHNPEEGSDALKAREGRTDCLSAWLVEHDQSIQVTYLHKMYGGIFPAEESNALSFLGELAPLACDTRLGVCFPMRHTMTKRLFERRWGRTGYLLESPAQVGWSSSSGSRARFVA